MHLFRLLRLPAHRLQFAVLVAALLLASMSSAVAAKSAHFAGPAPAVAAEDGQAQDALIGELVFHADLLSALDNLCPNRGPAPADWHGALRPLLEQAFTPELRDLSRRLGADAGAQLVHERGGCRTRGFAAAYNESKDEYRVLLRRWKSLGE